MQGIATAKRLIRKFCAECKTNEYHHCTKTVEFEICREIIDYLDGVAGLPPYWRKLEFLEAFDSQQIQFYVSIIYSLLISPKEENRSQHTLLPRT
jgi:hypothetical protein